jgi:16S rRNA G966 N2-methylase RsmD
MEGDVPGSGATSFGAALRGASRSTCVGSSREGAIVGLGL